MFNDLDPQKWKLWQNLGKCIECRYVKESLKFDDLIWKNLLQEVGKVLFEDKY